ncbi:MAG: hypothetical protein ABI678_24675 [Kofleriaceae bacterium]
MKLDGAADPANALARWPLVRAAAVVVHDRSQIEQLFHSRALDALSGLFVELATPPSASRIIHPLGLRALGLGAALDDHLAARDLAALRAFGSNAVEVDLFTHLPLLARLERLHIPGVRMTRAQTHGLFARTPRLRALSLQTHDENILDLIPAGVVELTTDLVDDHELAALARSPAAATLDRLALFGRIDSDLRPLAALARVRSLDLAHLVLDDDRRSVLAELALPALSELSLGGPRNPAMLQAIARAFGPQLALLEVPADLSIDALAPSVAGATRANRTSPWRELAIAATPREPWLSRMVVEAWDR